MKNLKSAKQLCKLLGIAYTPDLKKLVSATQQNALEYALEKATLELMSISQTLLQ